MDGPFIETKETIGSAFLIEARDMEEAARIASLQLGTIFSFHFIGQTTASIALVAAGVLLLLKRKSDDTPTY